MPALNPQGFPTSVIQNQFNLIHDAINELDTLINGLTPVLTPEVARPTPGTVSREESIPVGDPTFSPVADELHHIHRRLCEFREILYRIQV